MATITFGGMSSGLPPNLVDQLIDAEREPIRNLEKQKGKTEIRLELVNNLDTGLRAIEGTLGKLASAKGFSDIVVASGDPNIIGGVVDPSSPTKGSWNIEVSELAQKAAAITNGFPDRDKTEIGVGYFRFETPDGQKDVYINGSNSTLQGAADAINAAGVGVKASIINDRKDPDNPFRLMIAGEAVGDDNKISYPTLYFLDGDQDIYFDETRPAKNGLVKIDGFEFQVSENTVKDLVPGLTLELRQAAPGRSINISVAEDRAQVSAKVNEFVKSMNDVLGFVQSQSRMDSKTDTSKTLGGDSLVRTVEDRLRRLIQNQQMGISGPIRRLGDVGVTFNRNGLLELNEEKFNTALAKNPDGVAQFFAGDGFNFGFIPSVKREINNLVNSTTGPVAIRQRALAENVRRIDDRIGQQEAALAKKEQQLRRKFSALEETMARLKSQGGALAATASAPGGINLGGGVVR